MTRMKNSRRKGATLSLVAICVLVIVVIGVATFYLSRVLGGGRELANSTDSGSLSIAKQAIRTPSLDATDTSIFPNPDVATNFALLGEYGTKLDLMVYNRLVAQALIVAINAKDEATPESADNAKKVWTALNDVGSGLRKQLEDPKVMGKFFLFTTAKNNVRMLGSNAINLSDYHVGYLRKGGSTNVAVDPNLLAALGSPTDVPENTGGKKSQSGNVYMSGYAPVTIKTGAL